MSTEGLLNAKPDEEVTEHMTQLDTLQLEETGDNAQMFDEATEIDEEVAMLDEDYLDTMKPAQLPTWNNRNNTSTQQICGKMSKVFS